MRLRAHARLERLAVTTWVERRLLEAIRSLPVRASERSTVRTTAGKTRAGAPARLAGELLDRSIAGQIEFWAQLGRAIEPLLGGETVMALRKAGKPVPLTSLLASVDSPEGRRRVIDYLESQPFPHFEPAPNQPGLLVRVDADGTRTTGRFVGRRFQTVE